MHNDGSGMRSPTRSCPRTCAPEHASADTPRVADVPYEGTRRLRGRLEACSSVNSTDAAHGGRTRCPRGRPPPAFHPLARHNSSGGPTLAVPLPEPPARLEGATSGSMRFTPGRRPHRLLVRSARRPRNCSRCSVPPPTQGALLSSRSLQPASRLSRSLSFETIRWMMADQPHWVGMPRERCSMSRAWRPPFSTAARQRPSIWLESAQSPHCSALVVATVRYSVEEKPAVTCDNTQKPWSGNHRYLLCKQAAAGSSPAVSTR